MYGLPGGVCRNAERVGLSHAYSGQLSDSDWQESGKIPETVPPSSDIPLVAAGREPLLILPPCVLCQI